MLNKVIASFWLILYISFECRYAIVVYTCANRVRCKLGYVFDIFIIISLMRLTDSRVSLHVSCFAEGEREDCAFQAPNLREEHPQGQARKRFRSLRFQRKVLISLIAICQTTVTISQESSSICWPERVLTLLHSILAAKPRQRNTDHLASKANHK